MTATAGQTAVHERPARQRPARRPAGRRHARVAELEHLSLEALRAYRGELAEEESRVSYWRRIIQAKLDLLVSPETGELVARLRAVLSDVGVASSRQGLLRMHPAAGMPPLPHLQHLWTSGHERTSDQLLGELADAERALSSYRSALLDRLDQATSDLIARYREDPSACLAALPTTPSDGPSIRPAERPPGRRRRAV